MKQPLIAPKPMHEFTPEAFHSYVTSMFALRLKGRAKPPSPAPGLQVVRTKTGKLSIKRSKVRTFEYVTHPEMAALAKHAGTTQAELWTAFKERNFIIAKDRLAAEHVYSTTKEELMAAKKGKGGKAKPAGKKKPAGAMPIKKGYK